MKTKIRKKILQIENKLSSSIEILNMYSVQLKSSKMYTTNLFVVCTVGGSWKGCVFLYFLPLTTSLTANNPSFILQISTPIHCWFRSQRRKHWWNLALLSSTVKRGLKSVDGMGTVAFTSNFWPLVACETHNEMRIPKIKVNSSGVIIVLSLVCEKQNTVTISKTTRYIY